MNFKDIDISEYRLVGVVDSYDRHNFQALMYVYPDGTLQNIRNEGKFNSYNVFNQCSTRDASDYDIYAIPYNVNIAAISFKFDTDKKNYISEVVLPKGSEDILDKIKEKYSPFKEGDKIEEVIFKIAENSFDLDEKEFENIKRDFWYEESSFKDFLKKSKEIINSEEFKEFLKIETYIPKKENFNYDKFKIDKKIDIDEEEIPF